MKERLRSLSTRKNREKTEDWTHNRSVDRSLLQANMWGTEDSRVGSTSKKERLQAIFANGPKPKYPVILKLQPKNKEGSAKITEASAKANQNILNASKLKAGDVERSKDRSIPRFKTLLPQLKASAIKADQRQSARASKERKQLKRKANPSLLTKEIDPNNFMQTKNYYIRDAVTYFGGHGTGDLHGKRVRQHVEELLKALAEHKRYALSEPSESEVELPISAPEVKFVKPVLALDIDDTLLQADTSETYMPHDALLIYNERIEGIKVTRKVYVDSPH